MDDRTPQGRQIRNFALATMNLDRDELEAAGVVNSDASWTKWNNEAPMVIIKLRAPELNALAALIERKFSDVFTASKEAA